MRPAPGHDIVALSGELDLWTAPQLIPVVRGLLAQGRNRITLDLDDVTFMDAAALGILIRARQDVTRTNGYLDITHNTLVTRLLALTGLTTYFTTRPPPEQHS